MRATNGGSSDQPIAEDPDYIRAHDHSSRHEAEVIASSVCGCFYCLHVFPPAEINEWIDEPIGGGRTASGPKCGIDAVIGSAAGYPITRPFLKRMQKHWF
jgi:hypothetical protein